MVSNNANRYLTNKDNLMVFECQQTKNSASGSDHPIEFETKLSNVLLINCQQVNACFYNRKKFP
jgi:hypothetical protein